MVLFLDFISQIQFPIITYCFQLCICEMKQVDYKFILLVKVKQINKIMSLKPSSSSYLSQQYNPIELPIIYSSSKYNQSLPKQNRKVKYRKPIVANLADTQYPIIEEVCDQLQWRIQFNDSKGWDIKWSDSAVTAQFLSKMLSHQKINHFPGMNTLSRKNNLTKNLGRMQEEYQAQYDFYPRTFLLPHDLNKLKNYFSQIKRQRISKTFIVKPEANSQGRGIFLTQNINQIELHQHCLVQKYITNPLLYKNLKFDLRIYALIAGCDPLRIYIYNEGLTRFATEKYQQPDQDNMDNLYMHLTNYAINKDHPNYIYNDSVDNLSYGHKKSVAQFFQTLKGSGLKAHLYWADIKDVIIKTIISGQPHLQHQYRTSQPNNLQNDMCFQILGFDFMIDSNNKCHLLQINHTPSFTTDTPLDELVKSNLIRDTLILLNINSKMRQQAISLAKQEQQRRVFTGKTTKLNPEQRQAKVQYLQRQKQEYQKNNLGSYEKIYPSKNQAKQKKYQQLMKYSLQSYKETTGLKINKHQTSKFRVKKINTNQTLFQDQSPKLQDKSLKVNMQPSLKLNIQPSLKVNMQSRVKFNMQSSANNSMNSNQNKSRYQRLPITNSQQLKSYSNVVHQNITQVMNNLMTAAPVLNPQKELQYMDPILIQHGKKNGYIQKQYYVQGGRISPSIQKMFRKNNESKQEITQKDQTKWGMSQFMHTKDQQKTMFSKMLVKKQQF